MLQQWNQPRTKHLFDHVCNTGEGRWRTTRSTKSFLPIEALLRLQGNGLECRFVEFAGLRRVPASVPRRLCWKQGCFRERHFPHIHQTPDNQSAETPNRNQPIARPATSNPRRGGISSKQNPDGLGWIAFRGRLIESGLTAFRSLIGNSLKTAIQVRLVDRTVGSWMVNHPML